MRIIDLAVTGVYLVAMPALGVLLAGRQRGTGDYFLGGRDLPWWAVCLSVVATETSTLTVISVPTVAYLGSFTYLQLAIGYLVGRTVVAFVLLPRYYVGDLVSAYAFLGKRFGGGLQGTASVTFSVTRLLADGLRLFATAIPVKVVLASFGVTATYWQIILGLSALTVVYTYFGGIRAVVWVDVMQLGVYVGGSVAAGAILLAKLPADWFGRALAAGKFELFDMTAPVLTNQYSFVTAVLGGAVFAMASHGADQLMVQRLLSCRTLADSQRAVITSGVLVLLQFALFLVIGSMLWTFYAGAAPEQLGMSSGDALFPRFIVNQLPAGLSGLLIAGIIAAAMSTLSSSLNSLATSTVSDLYPRLTRRARDERGTLRLARGATVGWALVFVAFASLFTSTDNPVVEVGLGIASYTYGALLGAFLLGLLVERARQADAVVAFCCALAGVLWLALGAMFPDGQGGHAPLAFPWYAPIGVAITLLVGGTLSLRHRGAREETPRKSELSETG
ncbi:sodium:solute symporter [Actinopolyspora erythraea]|uniref:Sodium:solute symporter n=1 Tax=Actinopolyspora erythraea TaxID=414996 RepID=A0A099D6W8_9ACTN|nr:sodium:solute symporter [Actinopolyspora erythraea]ASU78114.1 sodium:solute symporter [Actinopolyspora erythraea]KGI81676.1 sodium:solute symporter [Actinopolyspora erythraea]